VVAKGHRFKYDHLVLSLGTLPDPERVPGLAQAAYDIASFDSVVQLKDALSDFGGGTVLVAIPQGATHDSAWAYGYALMAHALLAKDEAVMRKTKIKVVTAEKAVAPADSSEQLARLLSQRGIELRTKTRLTFVDPVKRFAVLQDGTKVPFDLLIAQFPRRPLPMLTECKLADRGGYVQSDSRTCKTRFANVYCIGECADMRMPYSNATPFPKSGAFAINQGVVVAEDIIQRLSEAGQGWVVDEGVKQSNSCVVAVETGNSEAVKITWDLFSDPYSGTTKVSPPGRENLKFLVSWWEELLLNWFRPHEPEPDKKKK
jgi:sulfide:quinone oxidoreductase